VPPVMPVVKPAAKDTPAADQEEEDDEEGGEESSLFIGVSGSQGREANVADRSWGPTVTLDLVSTDEDLPTRIRYGLEGSYNDATTRVLGPDADQKTRVRTLDLRYAKFSFLKLFGWDIKEKLGFTPYVAGGIQHVSSTSDQTVEDDATGARVNQRTDQDYWSPSWGVGAEIRLNSRLNFVLDFNRNTESGERASNRFTLELKARVFGAEE
jgi:hypothetical protein